MWSKTVWFAAAMVTIGVVGGIVTAQQGGRSAASIVGVWRVVEVTTTGENARTNTSPQPGLRIFTQRHYSLIGVTADKPRVELPPPDKATDKQVADAFRPFIANAGTYEIKGNEIHVRPMVAKNPATMGSGAAFVDTFKLDGDTLWTTAKSGLNGPVKNPVTVKFIRIE